MFYVAKEIMTSEEEFVNVLKLLNEDFRGFVENNSGKASSPVIPPKDFSKLFVHLPNLLSLNSDLLSDFKERIENWEANPKIADVIVKKGHFLKLYTDYVQNFQDINTHYQECCEKYPNFNRLVQEFERRPECRNLKISHYMLKPVQRLPQYRLLLENYLKNLDPAGCDHDNASEALDIVSSAASHANEKMKSDVRAVSRFRK